MYRGVGYLLILRNGTKYVNGHLHTEGSFSSCWSCGSIVSGNGSGFFGTFGTNSRGEIIKATVVYAGHHFEYNPELVLTFEDSYLPQNESVTGFDILSGTLRLKLEYGNRLSRVRSIVLFVYMVLTKNVSGGYGYINGDLIPEGGGGQGAKAKFNVDGSGSIISTYFENVEGHGGNFTEDPYVNIFFPSSRYNQVIALCQYT